jgi:hypothetical protein
LEVSSLKKQSYITIPLTTTEEETFAITIATVLAADVVRILWSKGGSRRSRLRTTRRTRKYITSSSLTRDRTSEELIGYKVDLARDSLMTSIGGGSV